MKLRKTLPTEDLQSYVKYLWVIDIEQSDLPFSQLYFPYGSFELIFYLDNRGLMQYVNQKDVFYQPSFFYSGQFSKPFTLSFDFPCRCFGVSFRPFAGDIFNKIPASEFTDKMIELSELDPKNSIIQKLSTLHIDHEVFKEIEDYIKTIILSNKIDIVSQFLAKAIILDPRRESTKKVISHIGLSKRRIEQRFIQSTGLSIGMFTRKIRFQKAVALLQNNPKSLTQIGLQVGYYDQSHFISEFKTFSSLNPLSFIKQETALKTFISSLVKN